MTVRLQLVARTGHPDFLDLPWNRAARGVGPRAPRRGEPRDQPPRRALRQLRREHLRAQGAAAPARAARVPAAAPPGRRVDAGREGGRRGRRAPGRPRRRAHHAPPRVLAALPRALRRHGRPRPAQQAARRARAAARAPAPGRLLLGRLVALEHALPPRRGRALGLPRRRRDRRAAPLAHGRAAPARPAHRQGEPGRRAPRRAGRGQAARRHRPVGDGRGDRVALRGAVVRAHERRGARAPTSASASTSACGG